MNELEQRIHAEIAEKGSIPFSRFMKLALYEPGLGYYETQREVGRSGDFYTSVSVGSLYGELLAFQFGDWLSEIEGPVQLVEAGAHDGRLSRDVLTYLRDWRPEIFDRCELILWETSAKHRQWQEVVLADFSNKVRWSAELESFSGVFFCNELLDACPVERLIWVDNEWWLSVVDSDGQSFSWGKRRAVDVGLIEEQSPEEGAVFTVGDYEMWNTVCKSLQHGRALVVDYGMLEHEFFDPPRENGTLRGYCQHRRVDDVLANPGEVDITASVNFTKVERMAVERGLEIAPLTRQSRYLVRLFERILQRPEMFPEWTPERTRQFQTLVHPEHLGHSFKVLECCRP